MDANRQFIRHEWTTFDALFDEVEAEMEAESNADQPEEPREPELRLPAMYLESGTEIVDISDEV